MKDIISYSTLENPWLRYTKIVEIDNWGRATINHILQSILLFSFILEYFLEIFKTLIHPIGIFGPNNIIIKITLKIWMWILKKKKHLLEFVMIKYFFAEMLFLRKIEEIVYDVNSLVQLMTL